MPYEQEALASKYLSVSRRFLGTTLFGVTLTAICFVFGFVKLGILLSIYTVITVPVGYVFALRSRKALLDRKQQR